MIKLKVLYQVYRKKEQDWYTYDEDKEQRYNVDSIKEAFYEFLEGANWIDTFAEEAWRKRKKTKNGFIVPTGWQENEDGKNYLTRMKFDFVRVNKKR